MRMRTLSLVVVLVAAVAGGAVRMQARAAYASVLSGSIEQSLCSSAGSASGSASGDLAGSFTVSLDCSESAIAGGQWQITVKGAGPDGAEAELGTLSGSVVGGAVQADVAGGILTASDVKVSVTAGTGAYAAVTSGSGTLELIADPKGSPQFRGTLRLSF